MNRRIYLGGAALAVIAFGTLGVGSWLSFTPQGQIMQVKWRLE